MIEFNLNDEPVNFTLNVEAEITPAPPSGPILMGDTTVLWGSTTVTFND